MKTNKKRWSVRAKALRNLMQSAEMRGHADIAAKHRKALQKALELEHNADSKEASQSCK